MDRQDTSYKKEYEKWGKQRTAALEAFRDFLKSLPVKK